MKDLRTKLDDWTNQNRPAALLGVVAFTVAAVGLLNWASGSDLFRQFFFPEYCDTKFPAKCDLLEWNELFQAAVLILGLPVAFMLWHWRDRNVLAQIEKLGEQAENARKDTNLKEFQEVQLRAAGALDEKLPQEAREQLQIAALHQLRGFLRGDYGESFKRPAFELLLAGHAAAVHRIGVPAVQAQLSGKSRLQVSDAVEALRMKLTPIDHTRMLIIRDEAAHIFIPNFPLDGRRFDLLDLSHKTFPEKLDLNSSHFFGANLLIADFCNASLQSSHFEGANLSCVSLKNADLFMASLAGATLYQANLTSAKLCAVSFESADLECAYFQNTFLLGAHLQGAECYGAIFCGADMTDVRIDSRSKFKDSQFNNATQFGDLGRSSWLGLTKTEREAARALWKTRGMNNVDD